jgi:site-specific DNA-methyltransferase (adenine-specific)/adenine-specific DNA-methyltransferase
MQGSRFIEFLRKRLVLLRELLSDDGSIYIRIDYHFGHFIKVITDEVFGPQFLPERNRHQSLQASTARLEGIQCRDRLPLPLQQGSDFVFAEQMRTRLCSFCGQEKEPDWHHMVSPGLRNPPERTILGRRLLPPRGQHWKYKQTRIEEMEKEGESESTKLSATRTSTGNEFKACPSSCRPKTRQWIAIGPT